MFSSPSVFSFHGGMHLDDHKTESLGQPLHTATLPAELIIRVSQHIGEPNAPVVKPGDTVKRGQLLAESSEVVSAPIHAPTSGTITAIEERPIAHPSARRAPCIILRADGRDEDYAPETGKADVQNLDQSDLLSLIRSAGIVGLGGAAFPTAVKLSTADQNHINTLIINGAECEPYITCDDILMQTHAREVIRGVQLLQHILHPRQTLVGIEDNKPNAIKAMQKAVLDTQSDSIQIRSIPTLYPSGGEKQLIKLLTGHEVHSSELSFQIGIVCQNVGTCYAIADALDRHQPLTSRIVTVTGPGVKNPGNWVTRLGTPISHLIDLAGGYSVGQPKLIMGGPMMGLDLHSDQVPVVKATNTVLVLDHQDQPEVQECIRCSQCAEVCPAQLLPQQLYWYSSKQQFDMTEKYHLFDCIECGCCAAVCPSHIPLVQYYRYAKSEIWEQRRKTYNSDRARVRHEFREARLRRQKQQEEEKRRLKREALAAKTAALKKTPSVDTKSTPTTDAVQAALERVKARKKALQVEPRNTRNLSEEQQRQIDEANARRNKIPPDES